MGQLLSHAVLRAQKLKEVSLTRESKTETKAKMKEAKHTGKLLQPFIFGIASSNPLWNSQILCEYFKQFKISFMWQVILSPQGPAYIHGKSSVNV